VKLIYYARLEESPNGGGGGGDTPHTGASRALLLWVRPPRRDLKEGDHTSTKPTRYIYGRVLGLVDHAVPAP